MDRKVSLLVRAALMAALVMVATRFASIPTGIAEGYIHLGDALVLGCAMLMPPWWAAAAAAVGSALADLLAGYALYIPATFIIKGAMALVAALIMIKKPSFVRILLASLVAAAIMVGGYCLFEIFVYGMPTALADVPFNGIQAAGGIILGVPLCLVLKRILPVINKQK
nr:ECF transporter S component [bacterium]